MSCTCMWYIVYYQEISTYIVYGEPNTRSSVYSGTSLIRTSIIRLLGLSGIEPEDILINAHATCMP